MTRLVTRFVICLLLVSLLLCGCRSKNPADYKIPDPPLPNDVVPGYGYLPMAVPRYDVPFETPEYAIESFNDLLEVFYTGESFVHYKDISFVGTFVFGAGGMEYVPGDPEAYFRDQIFGFVDASGGTRRIDICRETDGSVPDLKLDQYRQMPEVDNYYCVPAPANASGDFYSYCANGMIYRYYLDHYYYSEYKSEYGDRRNHLASVTWTYLDCKITVYTWLAEVTEDSGFFYDLTVPERAEKARDEFNNAILKAYIGNYLEMWWPTYIPVLCVVAAGTVYLIIHRKRKKTASKAAVQEIGLETEE